MRQVLPILSLIVFAFGLHAFGPYSPHNQRDYAATSKPNFIIIFTDDQGYNDLGCFGSKTIKTPHLDQMAKEGRKLTSFYSASSVCTPSRAALLTGSYPKRVGMAKGVIFPSNNHGLRRGDWKLRIANKNKPELYHLAEDIGESTNLAEQYPERVEALRTRMEELDNEINAGIRPRGEI